MQIINRDSGFRSISHESIVFIQAEKLLYTPYLRERTKTATYSPLDSVAVTHTVYPLRGLYFRPLCKLIPVSTTIFSLSRNLMVPALCVRTLRIWSFLSKSKTVPLNFWNGPFPRSLIATAVRSSRKPVVIDDHERIKVMKRGGVNRVTTKVIVEAEFHTRLR